MDGTVTKENHNTTAPDAELERYFSLLRKVATLDNCGAYLKGKGYHFTAVSWDEMIDKRFREPLKDRRLTKQDLFNFVHELEENSSKRVLLFQRRQTVPHPIFDDAKRAELVKKLKGFPIFGERSVGEVRAKHEVTEIRLDHANGQKCLVIKVCATQTEETLLSQRTDAQGNEVRTYSKENFATVNVVRLFESGLLEIKIHREKEAHSYSGAVGAIWASISSLIDRNEFETRNVHQLLSNLWDPKRRLTISKLLGIAMSTHRNGEQTVLEIRSGKPNSDLNSDADALASVDRFNQQHGADATGCRSAYIWVRAPQDSKDEERDLKLHMHGSPNEFSVLSKCRRVDYDRALSLILAETR